MFNSYVQLPEGIIYELGISRTKRNSGNGMAEALRDTVHIDPSISGSESYDDRAMDDTYSDTYSLHRDTINIDAFYPNKNTDHPDYPRCSHFATRHAQVFVAASTAALQCNA